MESFVSDGLIEGTLDLTTTELADELVGGELTRRQGPVDRGRDARCPTGDLPRGARHGELRPARERAREISAAAVSTSTTPM